MPEPDENPAAVRLGEELRQLRIAAGYPSIQALAARIDGYGESLITKVEQGRRTASRQLFPAWLDACAVHIETKAPVLTDGHRRALTALWELALKREGPIPEFIEKYLRAEEAAEFIRMWSIILIPGLLQIRDYALAMYDLPGIDQDQAAATVDVYMDRQSVIRGPNAPQVIVVLDEHVPYRLIGTPEIMARQVDHLLNVSELPNVTIQIARGKGAYWGLVGSFDIASGPKIPDTLKMLAVEDQTMEEPTLARKSLILFEKTRGHALNVGDSRAVLMEARDHWQSQQ
jgi:transcriptional regulator with XRE-family HTH domain